jgi:hypothetical protein
MDEKFTITLPKFTIDPEVDMDKPTEVSVLVNTEQAFGSVDLLALCDCIIASTSQLWW